MSLWWIPAGIPVLSAFLIISFQTPWVSPVPACSGVSHRFEGRLPLDLGLTPFQDLVPQFPTSLEVQNTVLWHLRQKGCVAMGWRAASGTPRKHSFPLCDSLLVRGESPLVSACFWLVFSPFQYCFFCFAQSLSLLSEWGFAIPELESSAFPPYSSIQLYKNHWNPMSTTL